MPDNREFDEKTADPTAQTTQEQQEHLFNTLTNGFGEACVANNVHTAIAIAVHPSQKQPIVFVRGHKYDIATLLAMILRSLKNEINEELNTDANMDYSADD